ncbi:L,D-peptidoglycan transpeptidase YkuD, ErfK/YbiS/YcfS/YnhG family [Bacillus sp. 71mf]|nr:L,D-peptidoglycan transpeptidase YkuD, ErfK/YbiS/YcfS/YnhG family [Bacillus sp. 71mf]SFT09132.1 L,D-peptidoglycan transpeptidase YkuD, ErfK/YbiS/YcfS/YnhG family [Bacillus sp. 103mf]
MRNKKLYSKLYSNVVLAGGAVLLLALPVQAADNPPATSVQENQIVAWTTGNSIWTFPYGLAGASYVGSTNDYVGRDIQLVQKMTLNNVVWYQFRIDGQVIGWLDSRALSNLKNIQTMNQTAVMGATAANGIWSMPYGIPGANYLGSTDLYAYRDIQLVESATYGGVQWYKFSIDGKVMGWIDQKALDNAGEAQAANFTVTIGRSSNNGIWTTPYGITGAQYVGSTNDYAYQTVQVVKTVKRGNTTWYQVMKDGKLLGWIDGEKAVSGLTNVKDENSAAVIGFSMKGDGIWSDPYGEYGASWIDSTNKYSYQNIQVVQSAMKGTVTWNKIMTGSKVLGWVDARVFTKTVSNIKDENRIALVGDTDGNAVWSTPYGENGASYVGSASNYDSRPLQIIRSLDKDGTHWYYFKVDGHEEGWIDAKAISSATNIQALNKVGHVTNAAGNAVWTKPYGMQHANYVGSAADFANQNLNLLQSATYNGVTWYQIEQNGRKGWLDSRAVSLGEVTLADRFHTIGNNNQLIVVTTTGYGTNLARIRTFERVNGAWKQLLDMNGHIGRDGFAPQMSENVVQSPRGKYSIGTAFGRYGNPGTKLPFRQITSDDVWVDDSNSALYNTWQSRSATKGQWRSAENMDIPAYNYGFVINYNTDRTPGAGSAIFFHVSDMYTHGCTGTDQQDVISILKWLDPAKNPVIIQSPESELGNY